MDTLEARVRCMEAATTIAARNGEHHAEAVVKIATVLYDYVNAQPITPERAEPATPDKQKSRRPTKVDLLS